MILTEKEMICMIQSDELSNQLKLKNLIIEHFIAPEEYKKMEKMIEWSEDINDWMIKTPGFKDAKTGSKRP